MIFCFLFYQAKSEGDDGNVAIVDLLHVTGLDTDVVHTAHVLKVPLPCALLLCTSAATVHAGYVLGLNMAAQVAGVPHAEVADRAQVDLLPSQVRARHHQVFHSEPQF